MSGIHVLNLVQISLKPFLRYRVMFIFHIAAPRDDLKSVYMQHWTIHEDCLPVVIHCNVASIRMELSARFINTSSAVAEMGDRGHNRHGSKRGGCCAPFAVSSKPENPARGLRSSPPACTASLVVGSSKGL